MLPIKLSGHSLGERQAILNRKVEEAFKNKIEFTEVKDLKEESDVDRLFKIDLANKYKNVDYILETLRSGDSFYVSRALKCTWLFRDSQYFDIVNPTYLQNNIFPQMSEKCIKKIFARIAVKVNEERAKLFYDFCYKTNRHNIASKFLIHCSFADRQEEVKNSRVLVAPEKCRKFCGNSFDMLNIMIGGDNDFDNVSWETLYECRDVYSSSNEKYLDLVEAYIERNKYSFLTMYFPRFSSKLSKDILNKYKSRVLQKSNVYKQILHRKTLLSNVNMEEAKIFAANNFKEISYFWSYYSLTAGPFLKLIEPELKFQFIKDEFKKQFPTEEFEYSKNFFDKNYHRFMTQKQKEEWSLKNLEQSEEFLGSDGNFKCYRYVNFDTTFVVLKELIRKATKKERRIELLEVIAEAAKTPEDVEQLLKYFSERHINEDVGQKISFMECILTLHSYKVVQHNWVIFNELFHSVALYKNSDSYGNLQKCALAYHILNDKEPPRTLIKSALNCNNSFHSLNLEDKEKEKIFEYMLQHFVMEAKKVEKRNAKFIKILESILNLLNFFDKSVLDYPAVVDMVKPHAAKLWHCHILSNTRNDPRKVRKVLFKDLVPCDLTEEIVLSVLKENVQNLNKYMPAIQDSQLKTIRLYSKLRVYFPDDFKQIYSGRFINEIKDSEKGIVYSVPKIVQRYFILETPDKVRDLMLEFVPKSTKIKYSGADERTLAIQEGICRSLHLTRPSLPVDLIMSYVKRDYVKYCIHSFGALCLTMPTVQVTEFIKQLINSPVSIQKHGLRLAFQKMTPDDICALVTDIWATAKNVSIRNLLFESVQNQVCDNDSDCLVPLLNHIISELKEDDGEEAFRSLTRNIKDYSRHIKGGMISTIWATISKLPRTNFVWGQRRLIVIAMYDNFELMEAPFLTEIISKYAKERFLQRSILKPSEGNQKPYNDSMLILLAKYLVCCDMETIAVRMQMLKTMVLDNLFAMWNDSANDFYSARIVLKELVEYLIEVAGKSVFESISNSQSQIKYVTPKPLFELLLTEIERKLSLVDNVRVVFDIKLMISLLNSAEIIKTSSLLENEENRPKNLTNIFFKFGEIFGNELGKELLRMMENNHYFQSLLFPIAKSIELFIYSIDVGTHFSCLPNQYIPILMIYVAKGLLSNPNAHLSAVALEILPDDCPEGGEEEYSRVVSEIKHLGNEEIRCLYHMKFGKDNKRRKYV